MSRLTKYTKDRQVKLNDAQFEKCSQECESEVFCDYCPIKYAFEKLARYEDLEEQGRLIELCCKVGDMVWEAVPELNLVENYRITDIAITDCGIGYETQYLGCGFEAEDFGKTVFLTKEEAEAKLEEMEGAK